MVASDENERRKEAGKQGSKEGRLEDDGDERRKVEERTQMPP